MSTSPASGCSSPAITRSSVDLPLPLGPSSAVSEPPAIASETLSSATKLPNRLVIPWTAIATGLLPSEEAHREQRQHCQEGKHDRRSVRSDLIERLEALLDVKRQRLGPSRQSPRHDRDGAELAERPGGRQHHAVRDPPADRGQRHAPERREPGGAECPRRLLLLVAELPQDGHHLAHHERQRDEDRG